MSAVQVAELMGWEPAHGAIPGATWRTPEGWQMGPPTTDQMLSWLRDARAFVALVVIGDHDPVVEYLHPEGFHAMASASTMSASIEIAVRAVAGGKS